MLHQLQLLAEFYIKTRLQTDTYSIGKCNCDVLRHFYPYMSIYPYISIYTVTLVYKGEFDGNSNNLHQLKDKVTFTTSLMMR